MAAVPTGKSHLGPPGSGDAGDTLPCERPSPARRFPRERLAPGTGPLPCGTTPRAPTACARGAGNDGVRTPFPPPLRSGSLLPAAQTIVSLDFAAVAAETSSLGTPQCTWQEASPAGTGVSRHPASAGSTQCGRHPAHEAHLCTEES